MYNKNMTGTSYVVVFPSIFAKKNLPLLISNIKKILRIKNQQFQLVKKDNGIILVEANDPVFASSAISLLFGVDKVAIARKTINEFDSIVSEIVSVGGNLLLKGERFLLRVEGYSRGFLTKDIEIAGISAIIEKKSSLEVKPGNDEYHDKLLYTFLTKKDAYVCIYLDKGLGGCPNNMHEPKVLCCIYDDLSIISCLETIKQGFSVDIMICYRTRIDLIKLVKILIKLIPLTLKEKISLEFFKINDDKKKADNFLEKSFLILIENAKKKGLSHVSLPVNPMVFGEEISDYKIRESMKNKLVIHDSLGTIEAEIIEDAKRLGINSFEFTLERLINKKRSSVQKSSFDIKKIISNVEKITITPGPNNMHEILDSLKIEH